MRCAVGASWGASSTRRSACLVSARRAAEPSTPPRPRVQRRRCGPHGRRARAAQYVPFWRIRPSGRSPISHVIRCAERGTNHPILAPSVRSRGAIGVPATTGFDTGSIHRRSSAAWTAVRASFADGCITAERHRSHQGSPVPLPYRQLRREASTTRRRRGRGRSR